MTSHWGNIDFSRQCLHGEECRKHAEYYLEKMGWSVLAVCPPDHYGVGETHALHCQSLGKSPWGGWKEYQDRLPTIKELQKKWRENPTLNVGVALGPISRIIRVDVDGPAGEARLLELSRGDLPTTPTFTSGRQNGGRGLLYAIPPGVVLRTTVERRGQPKQELRFQAKGAQTVLPPSRHYSGCLYSWVSGQAPWEIAAAVAPEWLIKQLQEPPGSGHTKRIPLLPGQGIIPEGYRDTELFSMASVMRRRGFSVDAIEAAIQVENETRCEPPLDASQVRKIAESVGRYSPAATTFRPNHPPTFISEVEV